MPAEPYTAEIRTKRPDFRPMRPDMQQHPPGKEEEEEEEEIYVSCMMAGGAAQASGEIEIGDVVLNVWEDDEPHGVLHEHKKLESIQLRLRGVCVRV
jgi:hypothetical protein